MTVVSQHGQPKKGSPKAKKSPTEGALLTADDVADWLKLSRSTIYSLAHSGELPSYRLTGRLRFRRVDVRAYIDAAASSANGRA